MHRFTSTLAMLISLVGLLLAATSTLASTPAPVIVTSRLSGEHNVDELQLTPDGQRVVYIEETPSGATFLYSAPVDKSAPPTLLSNNLVFSSNIIYDFLISADSGSVIYRQGDAESEQWRLFSVPVGGGAITPLTPGLLGNRSVRWAAVAPDGGRVIYIADQDSDQVYELYSVATTGGPAVRLSGPLAAGGEVAWGAIDRDGSRVFYLADQDIDGVQELYSVLITGGPAVKLNGPLAPGGNVNSFYPPVFGDRVLYTADQDIDGVQELYHVAAGGGPPVKLNSPLGPGRAVTHARLSPNGSMVVYRADQSQDEVFELYTASLVTGAHSRLTAPLGADRDVLSGISFTPDGRWVLYRADQDTNDLFELYAVPAAGGDSIRLNGPLSGETGGNLELSPDSRRVVYVAKLAGSPAWELYSAALPPGTGAAAQPPTKLNATLAAGGNVLSARISPDGSRVIYEADQEQDDMVEVFITPAAGGPSTKLNPPLGPNASAGWAFFSGDGRRVIYRADLEQDGRFAIYAAADEAPMATLSGPPGTVGVGQVELTVELDQPTAIGAVQLTLEPAGGDAVLGQDYAFAGGAGSVVVRFAPGETSKTVALNIQPNPARTAARTAQLRLVASATANLGPAHSLALTIAPTQPDEPGGDAETRVFLPLIQR